MESTERNYGIDLLKVFLAFSVIIIHINAGGTGKVLMNATEIPWKYLAGGLTVLCYPAVNTYILITGYFMYRTHGSIISAIKRLSSLWLSAVFFSVFGYVIVVTVFEKNFIALDLIKRFFPIIRGEWWFYTVYFVLVLFSPFINKLIDSITQKETKILLLIAILVFTIFPIFINWEGVLGQIMVILLYGLLHSI